MTIASSANDITYKFADNPDIGATPEDIWLAGGTKTELFTSSKMQLVSDNVADAPDGLGARTVYLAGVDDEYHLIEELLELDGTTPVQSDKSYICLHEAWISTGGTSSQVGTITITSVTGSYAQGVISPSTRSIMGSHYIVPDHYNMTILNLWASVSKADGGTVSLEVMNPNTDAVYRNVGMVRMFQNIVTFDYVSQIQIPSRSRIKLTGERTIGNIAASGGWTAALKPVS